MAERSEQRSSQRRSSHRRGPQEVLTCVERGILPTKERRAPHHDESGSPEKEICARRTKTSDAMHDLVVSPAMGVSMLEPGVVWARE